MLKQDSIIYQSERRQTETTACEGAKRPASEFAVDLVAISVDSHFHRL